MIKNDKQHQITKKKLDEFRHAFSEINERKDMDTYQKKFELAGLESQIKQFEEEISEYELLKGGDLTFLNVSSINEIPEAFVKARIARGLTQAQLAAKLKMREQQIQRYESSSYEGASIHRVYEVMQALELESPCFPLRFQNVQYNFSASIDQVAVSRGKQRIKEKKPILLV